MDQNHVTPTTFGELTAKLQRLNTNDSSQDSIFSRQPSSSSVATQVLSPKAFSKSLSFTNIPELKKNPSALSLDGLGNSLTKVKSRGGQPKSANHLTTTPTNEPQVATKWCIILVGLPASGKSSICKNLMEETTSYFQSHDEIADFKIDTFNAGNFRRKMSNFESQKFDFFDFNNVDAKSQRENFATIALDHLLNSLVNSQINVGVFDATNSTIERRQRIYDTILEKQRRTGEKINTMILHIKCSDAKMWRYNVEGKTTNADYKNKDHDGAILDFINRALLYRAAFEEITEEELKKYPELVYVQIDDAGREIRVDENGFVDDDDLIYDELMSFIQGYYKKYGEGYLEKVEKFWNENPTLKY
ncbi:CYFA0S01e00276g1_1 [Cyberlindnera fabianii]|uniref:CYFA0S01e00276g1_1 n=1 Tax=Cyberlindnera fabianii TaxID=36022 RepID=A0A061AGN6_CYBFA|nr:hypothetical protein BON22_0824 [Cyberlindnera fabianii]CDR36300.1 CYFA0S01e00276g1_1 [Cyberlindnera fabianii]